MEPFKTETHSFVVKFQLEETAQAGRATWRGQITHVPSGARRYLKNVDGIKHFIMPYLKGACAAGGLRGRIREWLRR